jgi:ADP-heptose:LPS heptosyltransferase
LDKPLPATSGKYCVRNPYYNFAMRCLDACLSPVSLPTGRNGAIRVPQRILIANGAHLGDVVMSTSMIPVLKQAFPECGIGFLVGSWSRCVIDGHPEIDTIHVFDHWCSNRSQGSTQEKYRQHLRTRKQALKEVRAAGYDIAIDLYWNIHNSVPFLWETRIPVRVAYGSGGFGPLATHCVDFIDKRVHASERYLDLIEIVTGPASPAPILRPLLPPVLPEHADGVTRLLGELGADPASYAVFHVATVDRFREWDDDKWRSLARHLINGQGLSLIFTGVGPADNSKIETVRAGMAKTYNLCDRLPWPLFVAAIKGARVLCSVDTGAVHVAAGVDTPCIVVTAGRYPYLWKPLGRHHLLSAPVPCAPCHRNYGCAGMECIRDVTVEQARAAVQEMLSTNSAAQTV